MSLFASIAALSMTGAAPAAVPADDYRQRRPEDEVVYFLLPDRFENGDPANDKGGLEGDRLATGYDPAAKGFFHGGDLKGVIRSEEHTSELQSLMRISYAVFCLKKKKINSTSNSTDMHIYKYN